MNTHACEALTQRSLQRFPSGHMSSLAGNALLARLDFRYLAYHRAGRVGPLHDVRLGVEVVVQVVRPWDGFPLSEARHEKARRLSDGGHIWLVRCFVVYLHDVNLCPWLTISKESKCPLPVKCRSRVCR